MAPALITWSSAASARCAPTHAATPSRRAQNSFVRPILASHEPVELARVLAGDLLRDVGRQVTELLLDVLGRLRPHAVAVRVVGAPHERLDAHVLDQLGADAVELERALALAAPVVARRHGFSRTSSYGAEYGKAGIRVRAASCILGPTPRMNPFSQIGANITRS